MTSLIAYEDLHPAIEQVDFGGRDDFHSPPPKFEPLPVPDGWVVDQQVLADAARPAKKDIFVHPKGFTYVKNGFIVRVLNKAFGVGGWAWRRGNVIIGLEVSRQNGNRTVVELEITVDGLLYVPLPASPYFGIGGAFWYPNNPGAMKASSVAAAETIAFKNAAKRMGIASELNDGSEDGDEAIATGQKTCETLFKNFVDMGHGDDAVKVARKIAPEALKDGVIVGALISQDHVDDLRSALTDAMIKLASG